MYNDLVGKYIFIKIEGYIYPDYVYVESIEFQDDILSSESHVLINNEETLKVHQLYAATADKQLADQMNDMINLANLEIKEIDRKARREIQRMKSSVEYSFIMSCMKLGDK